MEKYLRETKMLDYSNKNIQRLIQERNWNDIEEFERLKSIYNFVRDEILFGYNIDDNISASKVLADGYGQCNTKGTLFMALLRACNIPCRVHGFTIDKELQKGAMTGNVIFLQQRYQYISTNFHKFMELKFHDTYKTVPIFFRISPISKTIIIFIQTRRKCWRNIYPIRTKIPFITHRKTGLFLKTHRTITPAPLTVRQRVNLKCF